MAGEVIAAFRVSARRACDLVGCDRSTFFSRARRRDVAPLRMRLRELAAARPRFGDRRLHILLRREGWRINAKKTYRLCREEGLGVRVKRRRKRASQLRVVPVAPTRPNERWAMDFMADRLDDGRRIRILTIEDVFTRECLAVEVHTHAVPVGPAVRRARVEFGAIVDGNDRRGAARLDEAPEHRDDAGTD
jgi:putative transposase